MKTIKAIDIAELINVINSKPDEEKALIIEHGRALLKGISGAADETLLSYKGKNMDNMEVTDSIGLTAGIIFWLGMITGRAGEFIGFDDGCNARKSPYPT